MKQKEEHRVEITTRNNSLLAEMTPISPPSGVYSFNIIMQFNFIGFSTRNNDLSRTPFLSFFFFFFYFLFFFFFFEEI